MTNNKGMISVTIDGKTKKVPAGARLSEILELDMPCGGHGKCGKCRVKVSGDISLPTESEIKLLGEESIALGTRLSCLTYARGNCTIITDITKNDDTFRQIVSSGDMPDFDFAPIFTKYGAAIDIGTTTLAARLYDTNGNLVSEKSRLNPQSLFGADVVSRIEASLNGNADHLAELILQAIDELLVELSNESCDSPKYIDGIVLTGNTVMLHLLTKESCEPLSHAPFAARRLFGETLSAADIGLSSVKPETEIYLPPCISAFVGADTICALLSTEMCKGSDTAMLVDIGTNGEIALWINGDLKVCSTAAGPAFEGVGISMGMRGENGAIDRVWLDSNKLCVHTIGESTPIGICGSGLIDAIASLLENGELDETGYLEDDAIISGDVVITAKDIRMVQLAKGAIHAGINTALISSGIDADDLSTLYIAGGFGNYLNMENAGKIGLIPTELVNKVKTTGNSALSGASMLLLNRDFRDECSQLAKNAHVLDLSSNPIFTNEYMDSMMF